MFLNFTLAKQLIFERLITVEKTMRTRFVALPREVFIFNIINYLPTKRRPHFYAAVIISAVIGRDTIAN